MLVGGTTRTTMLRLSMMDTLWKVSRLYSPPKNDVVLYYTTYYLTTGARTVSVQKKTILEVSYRLKQNYC